MKSLIWGLGLVSFLCLETFNIPYLLHPMNFYLVNWTIRFGIWKAWQEDSRRQGKRPKQKGNWQKPSKWQAGSILRQYVYCSFAYWVLPGPWGPRHAHTTTTSLQESWNAWCPCYTTPRPATPRGCPVSVGSHSMTDVLCFCLLAGKLEEPAKPKNAPALKC